MSAQPNHTAPQLDPAASGKNITSSKPSAYLRFKVIEMSHAAGTPHLGSRCHASIF